MSLETEEWLIWLGINTPQNTKTTVSGDIQRLKDGFADYDAFQSATDSDTSFAEWETTLSNNGFTSTEAANLRAKAEQNFASWSDFEDFVVNQTDSYQEFQQGFANTTGLTGSTTTADGEPAAGIRIHDSAGVSYDGVDVGAGTIEVFGQRVEFSQQAAAASESNVTFANQSTDDADNVVETGEQVTISADATNPNSYRTTVIVPYLEDGSVVKRKEVSIAGNTTVSVEFTLQKTEAICVESAIADLSPVTICWTPPSITLP